jgi:hypothetical protein
LIPVRVRYINILALMRTVRAYFSSRDNLGSFIVVEHTTTQTQQFIDIITMNDLFTSVSSMHLKALLTRVKTCRRTPATPMTIRLNGDRKCPGRTEKKILFPEKFFLHYQKLEKINLVCKTKNTFILSKFLKRCSYYTVPRFGFQHSWSGKIISKIGINLSSTSRNDTLK